MSATQVLTYSYSNCVLHRDSAPDGEAVFSSDRRHRLSLHRTRADSTAGLQTICWVCLNPSSAGASTLDPTLRRILNFSTRWGFTEIVVLNLWSFIATSPVELQREQDPEHPLMAEIVREELDMADRVMCGWGQWGKWNGASAAFKQEHAHRGLWCLGLTQGGEPRHPLYAPRCCKATRFA